MGLGTWEHLEPPASTTGKVGEGRALQTLGGVCSRVCS